MSILSAAWKRNKNAIESIAKPLISHVPGVGGFVASRIQMSPTAAQASVGSSVNTAMAAIAPRVAVVQAEANGSATLPPPTAIGGPATALPGGLTPTQLALAGAAVVALLLLSRRT